MMDFEQQAQMMLGHQLEPLAGKRVLLTGCSAGIGLAITLQLLKEGCEVVGVARREERLRQIQSVAEKNQLRGSFRPLVHDCTAADFLPHLRQEGLLEVDVLLCNAGLARGVDPVSQANPEDWREMFETNLLTTIELIQAVLPGMIQKGGGHILGLGSIAGHFAYENGSVYCASKHALRAFFQSLRQETCGQNIRASLISPGLVETEFSQVRFRGDETRAAQVYEGVEALQAADIANQVVHVLQQPAHVNIDDIVIMPLRQGATHKIARKK